MTTKEEIRDWDKGLTEVEKVLCNYARAVSEVEDIEDPPMTHSMMRKEWGRLLLKVQQDLSDLGVVIKVERELPENIVDLAMLASSGRLVVVEPLIETVQCECGLYYQKVNPNQKCPRCKK